MTVLLSWIIAGLAALCLYLLGSASYHKWQHKQAAELAASTKADLENVRQQCYELMNQLRAATAASEKEKSGV